MTQKDEGEAKYTNEISRLKKRVAELEEKLGK